MASNSIPNESDGPANPTVRRVLTDHGNKDQRLLRVDQIYSRKDRQVHFVKTAKKQSKPDRFGKTALVVRRIISKAGMLAEIQIDVKSTGLKDLLLRIFDGVEGLGLNKTPPMAEPELLFHARTQLFSRKEEEKLKSDPDQSLINDIGTALRFIEEDYKDQLASLKSLVENNEITFDLLWAIFPPKAVVLAPKHSLMNQMQAMNRVKTEYGMRMNRTRFFKLEGRIVTHDGEDFGMGTLNLEFDEFEGAKKMTSLTGYPLVYHPHPEALRVELIARGRNYVSLIQTPACKEYQAASAVKETALPNGKAKLHKINCQGRVMLDPIAFQAHSGSFSGLVEPYVYPSYWMEPKDLTEDDLLVCAHWINGFSFLQKDWAQFAVSALADVTWNQEAFEKLVIDEKRRKLIHALVKSHRQDEAAFDDIVENKGQGLVGLLTGSPGVGKTLTAEAVAEVTHRPLYMVSSGELGATPDAVDKRLEMILEITRRWGCVLLIDEVDVFLASRGADLARDTLVSIFLRRLEYFRGVLILTTNRQSEIDPAFQSRIHFTLNYPNLNETSRMAVWRNFIQTVANTAESSTISESDIAELSKKPLNGRQIKNAVSCAVSLAREEKKPVTKEDIESLLEILIS